MADFDALVVGAGVVGIAVARALALGGRSVLLLEGEAHFGTGTSSRNSEVIHAGIYYPPDSLKTRLCIEGRERLYRFCRDNSVEHRKTGKIIFAHTIDQLFALDAILARARAAGVGDIEALDARQAAQLEPALACAGALWSPSTGIVDSHGLMQAMLGEAEAQGAQLVLGTRVAGIARKDENWWIRIEGDAEAIVSARLLVNSAGLGAQRLAGQIEGLAPVDIPPLHLARGNYFFYSGRVPFSRLIYPVPEPGGLGMHLTLDLNGQARFGPDVEWVETIDYAVDANRRDRFEAAARRIWPALDAAKLYPGYSGIRPKISGPTEPAGDFIIAGPRDHGLPGLVNLFGIESPGLTASLAIAALVTELLVG
jgi:L-2-hydroxyglutarate oxidase LhgO